MIEVSRAAGVPPKNLATWSIHNPIPTLLLFMALALAGAWGFHALSIQNLPDIDLPTVNVTLAQAGAAPAQLETEVARRVEDSLATLSGLRHLRTSITDGRVGIVAEFALEKNLSDALIETKNAVDRVRSDLPVALEQPTVSAVTETSEAVRMYAVTSTRMDESELSWFVDDTVGKTVLAVPGVGRFDRVGGVQREVHVELDPLRLAALDVTVADVSRGLRESLQESSGGRGQLGEREQSTRTIASVREAADLEAFSIVLPAGGELRLNQVATVHDTFADRAQVSLLDGAPVVGFRIFRARGFDEIRVADGVEQALRRLQERDPSLTITPVSGSVGYTLEQYAGSMSMLYEGALLAVIVVWIFLRDWRATLVAAVALPLSILPAFAVLAWLGYSLNTLTLLALAVVVGILVDDAIVEVENIERHGRMGKPVLQATADAVTEIALAVIATTMSLVVVFLPTAMMSGVPGLFFKQFGWTVVIAVLASLLVARLLTPMMAVYLLRPGSAMERTDGRAMLWYLSAVRWCLKHRSFTLLIAIGLFAGSLALLPLVPSGLMPASDRGYTTVDLELPPGSSLQNTVQIAERARAAIADVAGIRSVFMTAGETELRKATLVLTLLDREQRASQSLIEHAVREQLLAVPGARFTVGGGEEQIQLILASDNASALKASAQALERQLRGVGQLSNISSTATLERPEIVIRPDALRAAERGVTTTAIGEVVRVATGGDLDPLLARLNLDTRQIYIRARISDAVRRDLEALGNLRVRSGAGSVPLSSVAELAVESGPSQIDRYDRRRYVAVSADLGGMPLGNALNAVMLLPAVQSLPGDVVLIPDGDAEIAGELATGFATALIVGGLSLLCVLVLLFKDLFQPITILSALPLSLVGALAAIFLTRSELDVPAMIGLVMLMGVVAKNSILLVEYAVVARRDRRLCRHHALLDACHKRARPIVMTTLAMIAGMLPIALGFGADASFRQPMAIAVIGGLLTSTALSLVVVPVVFTCLDRCRLRLVRRMRRNQALIQQSEMIV